MKTFSPPCGILTILFLVLTCLFSSPTKAQTIIIDSTFTTDGEILPFSSNDTIYGLSISGYVTLLSETSLVRVILADDSGNEWMVYEVYPLIAKDTAIEISDECDETCFLEKSSPYSISIQIIDAEIYIYSINLNSSYSENLSTFQYQAKRSKDLAKVGQMNENIQSRGWNWIAEDNSLVAKYYFEKASIFTLEKYNMQGMEYYVNGSFKCYTEHENLPEVNSPLPGSFDWRDKHDARTSGSKYYLGADGWLTRFHDQKSCGSCWAFSTINAVEAAMNLYYNQELDYILSEQDLICNIVNSCDSGGSVSYALLYFASTGVIDSNCLSYGPWEYGSEECIDSLCQNSEYTVKITDDTIADTISDMFKRQLMENGPIIIGLVIPEGRHAMCLTGYRMEEDNTTIWIFKNSWQSAQYYEYNGSVNDFRTRRIITLPVWNTKDSIQRQCYDRDKDGYYNWGIGSKPSTCPVLCSDDEDWNDNRNRVGPRDSNFNGIEIKPDIMVQRGTGLGNHINNGDIVMITGNIQTDTVLTFQINNPGTAQLNLIQINLSNDGLVEIPWQNPPNLFQIQDYPSKFVCMDNDTTIFKIRMNQGADTGAFARVQIHLNEPDMDSIFEFTLVYNGCETIEGYDSINSEVVWTDTCRAQCKDLVIQRNGMLFVTETVMFSPDADIIIEPGGKLILDGGKLTRLCSSELWNGIQVWGDSSLSQYPDTNQGYLGIRNGGMIEYAETGAFVGKIVDGDTLFAGSGGIVEADDAIFLNNETDVEFLPFINDHHIGGNEIPNISFFRNSTFKTCDPDGLIERVKNHVLLDGVNGVDFYACSFFLEDTDGQHIADVDKGTGIYALDAQVYVKGLCSSQSIPCTAYDSCYFKNLRYGIRAFGTGGFQYLDVSESVFDENTAGIYLSGYHHPAVMSSRFRTSPGHGLIPNQEDAFYGGLYLDGSSGFKVENNYFTGPNVTVPDSGSVIKIGVYIKDSGPDENEIYNNYFTGLDAGIVAEGVNKGKESGLCLKCNDFRTCLNDMMVTDSAFYYRGKGAGIKENQGTDDTLSYMLAGNTFTPEVQGLQAVDNGGDEKYYWSYFNNADHLNYYHHGYNSNYITYPLDTTNYSNGDITLHNKFVYYSKTEACPISPSGPGYKNIEDPRLEMTEAEIQLLALQYKYDSLIDGGDTEDLDFEIITSMPDEALELRAQLLSDSPYLSDTILKQAIYKETVLPNAMIRDVLTANPQSAKSNDILVAVDSRYDPMPDYMMAEIMQGLDQIGALESLESIIGYWSNYRSRAVNTIIREFLTDTTLINAQDSLINLLQNETSLESKYRLVFARWENNQSEVALEVLNDITTNFTLNVQEQFIHQQYLEYFGILQMMKDSSLNARQLDSSSIQSLYIIMNLDQPLISDYAKDMLVKGRHIEFTESVVFPLEVKKYPAYYYLDPDRIDFPEDEKLYLFPNPCGDFVIAYYNTLCQDQIGSLMFYDLNGKELDRILLHSLQNQQTINISNYADGAYIIRLSVHHKTLSSKILIKGRK